MPTVIHGFVRLYIDWCACLHAFVLFTLQLYPYECQERLVDLFTTGDDVTVDLTTDTLINNTTGESVHQIKS